MFSSNPQSEKFGPRYNLYNGCTSDEDSSKFESGAYNLSLLSDHSSTLSGLSGSQLNVSEIVNPDGSVTVRNLLVQEDGTLIKKERKLEDQKTKNLNQSGGTFGRNSSYGIHDPTQFVAGDTRRVKRANAFERNNSFDRVNPKHFMAENTLGMKRVDSFDSGSACSSAECSGNNRTGFNESTEAAAHRLRRQRLAQSPSSALNYTVRACSPEPPSLFHGVSPPPIRALKSGRQSRKIMNSMVYSPSNYVATSVPSPTRQKHVAFSEPEILEQAQPIPYSMSSPASSNIGDFGCWPVEAKNCYDPMGHKTSRESSSSVQSHEESSIFDGVKKNFNAGKTLDQLVDLHEQQNSKTWISYLDKEGISPSLYSVTVRKGHRNEKIGIFVHLKRFPFGNRLVVSQISPAGKFADTGIEVGDVVVSINAENMIKDPKTQRALDIVTSATDTVTIVVQKHLDSDDFQSATETSISSISKDISSIAKKKPHFQTIEKVKTMDSSEHKPIRKNTEDINKRNTARKREEMTSDGSMLISKDTELKGPVSISMKESWKLTGAIVVSVEKSDSSENPGIRMGMKETSSGRAVCISEISPSSLFARTPLRMGDIILSINNVSLHDNADVFDAYAAMGKSEKRITLVAKKGGESLNDFLLAARSQPVMKGKLNRSGHDSFDSQLSSKTAGTVGTTASGESGRGGSNDSFESFDGKSEDGVIGFKSTEEWKSNFRHDAVNNTSKAVSSPSRRRNEFEFDEESYGASLFGYNASSNVRIIKSYCDEDIGFKMLEITTEWGRLLVVSNVTPRSLASCTDLKVGDAILSINGISFRKKASAARASSIIRDAHREVYIEYQKLSSFSPAVPVDLQIRHHEKGEVLKTRSFDSYDSVSKKQADVSHSEKLKGNEENSSLEKALASGQEKQVGRYAPQRRQNSPVNTSERRQNSPVNTPERRQNSSVNTPVRRKNSSVNYQKLRVTVTKDEKKQTVGISLATVNNKLIVTEISAKGLLRHSPLVHGDTILAINGVSFRDDPNAKKATLLVKDAPKKVSFEVLKTENLYQESMDGVSTKSCVPVHLICSRRRKANHNDNFERVGKN